MIRKKRLIKLTQKLIQIDSQNPPGCEKRIAQFLKKEIRTLGFKIKEFNTIMDDGMLPKEDPKMALARTNFDKPLDINEASYEDLIRIPGIGPKTAKIISENKEKITKYEQLHKFGARIERAKPFISVNGYHQKMLDAFC